MTDVAARPNDAPRDAAGDAAGDAGTGGAPAGRVTKWLVLVAVVIVLAGLLFGYGHVTVHSSAWSFVKRFVPETKGRSLDEIQEMFDAGAPGTGTATANASGGGA